MNVKLIGVSGNEDLVVHMARVSNPSNQETKEGNEKLIRYLITNQHWSPFEMVNLVMEINTTRDIARQILRHRSFSFQEFSQRYADPTKSLSFELREARLQDNKNRQNSITTNDALLHKQWIEQQQLVVDTARSAYDWAIDHGIAKEQARVVLPEGNTQSRLYMNGTLRSWIHYCTLRMSNGTQKEHADVAKECWKIVDKQFPNVVAAVQ
jgi:thymidylate synthase (FAD)